jgi:hypothetical protein
MRGKILYIGRIKNINGEKWIPKKLFDGVK